LDFCGVVAPGQPPRALSYEDVSKLEFLKPKALAKTAQGDALGLDHVIETSER